MAQIIFETVFDICYLIGVITVGIIMFTKCKKNLLIKKFGFMAILLGIGDSFHLVPRIYALWTTGLEENATALGIGKLITSITMTIFYLILYYIWRERYNIKNRQNLTISILILTTLRIIICLFPQNDWLNYSQPISWGILRNIPFAIIGIIIIILFERESKKAEDQIFRFMPLAISLSFYIIVVLFNSIIPMIGMLMIPKTLAYVWIVLIGYKLYNQSETKE